MSAYKPGTVAVATVRGVPNVRVVRGDNYWAVEADADDYVLDRTGGVTDVRPLVVLDIDFWPPFIVKFLRGEISIINNEQRSCADSIADQIEAQTRPPKPAEPTGLGAVVEDAEGSQWVRIGDRDWYCEARGNKFFDRIDAVRVLSEGVSDD